MDANLSPTSFKDYYKILEIDYDATDDKIRLNYRKLALVVLSDPDKRLEYDLNGNYEIDKYTLGEYLSRFKGMILTCNGLGISPTSIWYAWLSGADSRIVWFLPKSQPLKELNGLKES